MATEGHVTVTLTFELPVAEAVELRDMALVADIPMSIEEPLIARKVCDLYIETITLSPDPAE